MRKMKDSGIEWIGYINEDWKLIDKDVTKELMSELDGSLDKIFND